MKLNERHYQFSFVLSFKILRNRCFIADVIFFCKINDVINFNVLKQKMNVEIKIIIVNTLEMDLFGSFLDCYNSIKNEKINKIKKLIKNLWCIILNTCNSFDVIFKDSSKQKQILRLLYLTFLFKFTMKSKNYCLTSSNFLKK